MRVIANASGGGDTVQSIQLPHNLGQPPANVFSSFWEILATNCKTENSYPTLTLQKKPNPTCLERITPL